MDRTLLVVIISLLAAVLLNRLGIADRLRGIRSIGAREANELISNGGAVVLDVRTHDEYAAARIPAARHIPLPEVRSRIDELESYRDKPIVISCRSGSRSARACAVLKKQGFTEVYNLRGGLRAWAGANLAVEN